MRTAELRGPALEYWFMKATGQFERYPNTKIEDWEYEGRILSIADWDTIGPLIHREGISLTADPDYENEGQFMWRASYYGLTSTDEATPFLAVMRVVVNKTYGDMLPDEEVKVKVEKAA